MPLSRNFPIAYTYCGVSLDFPASRDNCGIVNDDETVVSRDNYILLERDPPGSNTWVKRTLNWNNFLTNATVCESCTVGDSLTATDVTFTGTLSGPDITDLQTLYGILESRVTFNETDIANLPSAFSSIAAYKSNTPVAYSPSAWYVIPFDTVVNTIPEISYDAGTDSFTILEAGVYMFSVFITRNNTAFLSRLRLVNTTVGDTFAIFENRDCQYISVVGIRNFALNDVVRAEFASNVVGQIPQTVIEFDASRMFIIKLG